ncbi:FHA domain-containing protein [Paenibacillus chitinolyticus]|nr:FHA domain-containing protein [Paenibacillus chitinolyticus]
MEIFGLQASIRLSQGRWLEVGLEEDLNIERLAPVQLKMLAENPIPRVLPLKVEEINSHVRLLYNLASRRSLAAILKERSPDPAGCLQLLHEAAACVSDSGNFMLNEAQFVVDKNYMYIESGWADVSLLCLPIKEIPVGFASVMWSALVRDLASRLIAKDRGSLERLAKYCERENFSVREFKRQIYLEISGCGLSVKEDSGKGGVESDSIVRSSTVPDSKMQDPAQFCELSIYAFSVLQKPGEGSPVTEPLQLHKESNEVGEGLLRRESAHMPRDRIGSPQKLMGENRSNPKPRGAAEKFIRRRQQIAADGSDYPVPVEGNYTASASAALDYPYPVSPDKAASAASPDLTPATFAVGSSAAASGAVTRFSASAEVNPTGTGEPVLRTAAWRTASPPTAAPIAAAQTQPAAAVGQTAPQPAAAVPLSRRQTGSGVQAAGHPPQPHAAPQAALAGAAASAGPLPGSRGKILALGGAFLIIGMIWNAYFSAPGPPLLYISSGATLLVLDAAYVLLAIGLPGRRSSQLKEAAPSGSSPYPPAAEQEPVSLEQYYAGLGERTTLLAPPLSAVNNADETVYLGAESAPPHAKFRHPVLEVMREGRKETILLDTDSFIIGRGEGDVDYIEDVLGISRIHAQFLRTPEGFAVKDLGSRNGTFLNDGMLVPYQMVALKDGDVVRIIHTEFTFRFG